MIQISSRQKKAKRTKVTMEKGFAKAKTADEVVMYLRIPARILPGLFEEWHCACNKNCTGDEVCGANLLESPDADRLNF